MENIFAAIHEHIRKGATLSTDSRKIDRNTIFFALKGEKHDANEFVEDVLSQGALAAVSSKSALKPRENLYIVPDVLDFLQQLAKQHRDTLTIPVLGITGTNGKTTTKELVNAVLSKKHNTLATQGNYNNHIGVPLTLLQINASHELAVIEMGANHLGEIDFLCQLAMPTAGLITNTGKAHIEGFGSPENIVTAKTELYRHIIKNQGTLFVNKDNPILMQHCHDYAQLVTYSGGNEGMIKGQITASDPFLEIAFTVKTDTASAQEITVKSKLIGDYNFENIMAAIAIGVHYGVDAASIKQAIEEYAPNNSRSQLKKTEKNTLIMDAYNANPTSMGLAIDNFYAMKAPSKMLILGDMLEMGSSAQEEHQAIVDKISTLGFYKVILVGTDFYKTTTPMKNFHVFKNTILAEQWLKENHVIGQTILIKGSRGIQLEKLEKLL